MKPTIPTITVKEAFQPQIDNRELNKFFYLKVQADNSFSVEKIARADVDELYSKYEVAGPATSIGPRLRLKK